MAYNICEHYNKWYWDYHRYDQECNDRHIRECGLYGNHCFGRFDIPDLYQFSPDTLDDYPVWFFFRGHTVDIIDAINRLCEHCNRQWATMGSYWEPPDAGCAHDFDTGPCPFASWARYIEKLLWCPPGTYELEGW